MAQLAIKGHATRGSEVIEILEMLGGKNSDCSGKNIYAVYSIPNNGYIYPYQHAHQKYPDDFIIFTLEEFKEKFPYKVGDEVIAYAEGCLAHFTIQDIRWNNKLNKIEYKICSSWYDTSIIQPYKEETMEEKTYPPYMDYDVKTVKKEILPYFLTVYDSEENKHEIVATDGYEIKEENGKYYAVKKKPQYPKTYEECCMVLQDACMTHKGGYKADLIQNFQKLLICRDAYWKIAGEKMGLGKLWEPDLTKADERKYCIVNTEGNITKWVQKTTNKILAFPTEEMRDAFYENFKELIETCKELL